VGFRHKVSETRVARKLCHDIGILRNLNDLPVEHV
jgi:hypothetical protein